MSLTVFPNRAQSSRRVAPVLWKAPPRGCLTALATLLAIPALQPAYAACTPSAPVSGDTVTCSGDVSGFATGGQAQLTVNVAQWTNFNGALTLSSIGDLTFAAAQTNINGAVVLNDIGTLALDTHATFNQGLQINGGGGGEIIIRASSQINHSFTIDSDGSYQIYNYAVDTIVDPTGTLNQGIVVTGDGAVSVTNGVGASINHGVEVTGAAATYIENSGTFQNRILTDTGDDTVINNDTGTINGTIAQGAGEDTILVLGGTINASIDQGDDDDLFDLRAGRVQNTLHAGAGDDLMIWEAGTGVLTGSILMEDGDDEARIFGQSTAIQNKTMDGGLGDDYLIWSNSQGNQPQNLANWERFDLLAGSTLTLSGAGLTLGDTGTGSGTLYIDPTSTLFAGGGDQVVGVVNASALTQTSATLVNAGTIDLTNGTPRTNDSLRVVGNYVGDAGTIKLQTVLNGDDSPSDKLVIDGGEARGATALAITNLGGSGEETAQDGILVVQAVNSGTTIGSAFALAGPVVAGPYEYLLYRSGKTAGTEENWYLRNTIDDGGDGDGGDGDGGDGDGGDGDGGDGDGGDGGDGDGGQIPTYRPDVPLLTAVPSVARELVLASLGTFHERYGEQFWLSGDAVGSTAWVRIFADNYTYDPNGPTASSIDGTIWGIQAGVPLYIDDGDNGRRDVAGLFFGYGRADADVTGFALGSNRTRVGSFDIDSYSLGGHWTVMWPDQTYIDAVLMYSWLDVHTRSTEFESKFDGSAITASLEAGTKFPVDETWSLEPQAQFIWSREQYDAFTDPGGRISVDGGSAVTARLGGRLQGRYQTDDGGSVRPYLMANLWHMFDADTSTRFNAVRFTNDGRTTLEVGAGVTAELEDNLRLYANVAYETGISDTDYRNVHGRMGLRISW